MSDTGFNLAIGFPDNTQLDPRIATWKAEHVVVKNKKKSVVNIPFFGCERSLSQWNITAKSDDAESIEDFKKKHSNY